MLTSSSRQIRSPFFAHLLLKRFQSNYNFGLFGFLFWNLTLILSLLSYPRKHLFCCFFGFKNALNLAFFVNNKIFCRQNIKKRCLQNKSRKKILDGLSREIIFNHFVKSLESFFYWKTPKFPSKILGLIRWLLELSVQFLEFFNIWQSKGWVFSISSFEF